MREYKEIKRRYRSKSVGSKPSRKNIGFFEKVTLRRIFAEVKGDKDKNGNENICLDESKAMKTNANTNE